MLVATVSLASASGGSAEIQRPEIGVTYMHTAIDRYCGGGQGLIPTYDYNRALARQQLAAMRAAGIDSIRILVWHFSTPPQGDVNNLPSAGGHLREPYRTNLVHFVSDVRETGFKSMIVEYSPQWTNSPFGQWGPDGLVADTWDPSKFDENWQFIRDTRALIKRYGPAETWFDPASEYAPTDYLDAVLNHRIDNYLAEMYRRYGSAFGKDDLIFFLIAKGSYDALAQEFKHLVRALESTGYGLPSRFGVHPTQASPVDLENLRDADAIMTQLGLDQPLVIGEMLAEGPKSAALAHDVAQFVANSGRLVPEIYLWYSRFASDPVVCVSAPYRADSYIKALTGLPPSSTLTASVKGRIVDFRTPYGQKVSALSVGTYRIVINDRSSTANFHLVGPKLDRRTGLRSTSAQTWTVELRAGIYHYSSDHNTAKGRHTLAVLASH